jgi:anti-anti-sigma regulatory factor
MSTVQGSPAAHASVGLRCLPDPTQPVPVLRLVGRLDTATSTGLRTAVHKTLAEEPAGLVLDLRNLVAAEDPVLTVFLAFANTAAQWPGCPVMLSAPSAPLAAALERQAITHSVPVHPTTEQAVAAVQASPLADRYRGLLAGVPASAARARALVAEACAAWRLTGLLGEAQIVVTELVTNGVQHAVGDLTLVVRRTARFLHVAVHDRGTGLPVRGESDPEVDESGRGLMLVEAIAAAWGTLPTTAGKVVWATLRLPN